jgi:SAM-dependent methyltransferase
LSKPLDDMGKYWDDQVLEWERSSYAASEANPGSVGALERLAGLLRGHIRARQVSCLEFLEGRVEGKVCLELGSATGSTCFALLERGASRVIGLDISNKAVEFATAQAASRGIDSERLSFHRFAAGDALPIRERVDIALGLGIAEYIEPQVFLDFIESVAARQIYFSFDERRLNLQKVLHFVYRNLKDIPYYKTYAQSEIRELISRANYPELRTYREGKNAFVTSFV